LTVVSVVLAAATSEGYGDCVAGFDRDGAAIVAKILRGNHTFGLAADIHNYVVVVNGDNGSLQRLARRIVRRVFVLLLFELGEDIAERRFILRGWFVPKGVIDLIGLLHDENARFRLYSGTPASGIAVPDTMSNVPPTFRQRWLRPQDLVWLLLFSALALVSTDPTPQEIALVFSLGLFQVIEPKVVWFATHRGAIASTLIKLALCYLLIGFTGGISSTYYVTLLLPVVSAATTLSPAGTTLITALAIAAYISFLLLLDWTRYELTRFAVGELGIRVVFLPVVAFLTQQLADANRVEAKKYQAVAEQLEAANRNLQEAEAAVRRSERLVALGQLTAGLAHELRNPLGTMRASAELLVKRVNAEDEITRELAGFISSEVDRTNSLITRFLEFARPLRLRREATDITLALDEAIRELERHQPPFEIAIHRNYAPEVPPINIDRELMVRVFYNLLLNAAQASPRHAAITAKTRLRENVAEISILDRGAGIPKEHMENIFNPFFTTKTDGVGLGLAIVSKIVDEHGGSLRVETDPGRGSSFQIFLPLLHN
jgi:two-component system, NtrC family, sensor histidine kinase HydH